MFKNFFKELKGIIIAYKKLKIYQYLLDGTLVKEWNNINLIKKELNFNRFIITCRCKHNSSKQYKKHIWSYTKKPNMSFIKFKSIFYDGDIYTIECLNGNIYRFLNIKQLEKELGNIKILKKYYINYK